MMAGVNMVDVIYQGEGAAMPDLIGGRTQAMFGVMPASLGYLKSGKLRALAVTSAKRQELSAGRAGHGGILAGLRSERLVRHRRAQRHAAGVVDTLNKQVNAALADPATRKRFTDLGCDVFTGSPADFEKLSPTNPRNGRRSSSSPISTAD